MKGYTYLWIKKEESDDWRRFKLKDREAETYWADFPAINRRRLFAVALGNEFKRNPHTEKEAT